MEVVKVAEGSIVTIVEQLSDGMPRVTVAKITRIGWKFVYGVPIVREEGETITLPLHNERKWQIDRVAIFEGEHWELVDKEMQYRKELTEWNEKRSAYYREVSREEYGRYVGAVALKMSEWDRDNHVPKNPFAGLGVVTQEVSSNVH
jgi:hypothetical protein